MRGDTIKSKVSMFIVHYTPLQKRKLYIQNSLIRNFNPQWIDEKLVRDAENPLSLFLDKAGVFKTPQEFCNYSPKKIARVLLGNSYANTQNRKVAHFKALVASYLPTFIFQSSTQTYQKFLEEAYNFRVSSATLELCTQHLLALFMGINNMTPWILVLEDDSVINESSYADLNLLTELPSFFSAKKTIIHLNSSRDMTDAFKHHSQKFGGIYRVSPPSTRNASAYLISRDIAKLIIGEIVKSGIPKNLPIDFLLQVASRHFRVKTYWQEPPLFFQGSETGQYASNFDGNRSSLSFEN